MTPRDRDGNPLCILTVHAHPDDEASKGAATVARYHDEGVRSVLVCCTGGEAGEILNPAVDTPETRADLPAVRMRELRASADAIGYDELHLLGYHDSGMPDSEDNARPDNFANAPLDEAVERLVRIIRAERPQVIVSYVEDRSFYPHPDHIRVFEICGPAFEGAGDPDRFPDAGEPWQPSKLYETAFSIRRIRTFHEEFVRLGEESPFAQWLDHRSFSEDAEFAGYDNRFTTFVDVGDWLWHRRAALLAHRTQVDPEGFWMRLPDDTIRRLFPWEEYILARSLVPTTVDGGQIEDDLFAGVRDTEIDSSSSSKG